MEDLSEWRNRIDEVDEKILGLLNERTRYVIEIGRVKSQNNLNVYDPEREKDIISRLCDINTGPLTDEAVQRFFKCLFTVSKLIEKNNL